MKWITMMIMNELSDICESGLFEFSNYLIIIIIIVITQET